MIRFGCSESEATDAVSDAEPDKGRLEQKTSAGVARQSSYSESVTSETTEDGGNVEQASDHSFPTYSPYPESVEDTTKRRDINQASNRQQSSITLNKEFYLERETPSSIGWPLFFYETGFFLLENTDYLSLLNAAFVNLFSRV